MYMSENSDIYTLISDYTCTEQKAETTTTESLQNHQMNNERSDTCRCHGDSTVSGMLCSAGFQCQCPSLWWSR